MGQRNSPVRIDPLPATPPELIKYTSPGYDRIEQEVAREFGNPQLARLLRTVRVHGERSDADMRSPAGAMTVYQIIPSTRDAFLRQTGIDAYASPRDAARVAALHLKESLARNSGDITMAFAEYNAGPKNAKSWQTIPETREYVRRTQIGFGQ